MSAKAGHLLWLLTTDGTAVNMSMFQELSCHSITSLETMVTNFQHPIENYLVYAILDPCHREGMHWVSLAHFCTRTKL